MPKGTTILNAFTGGEIAPEFEGRTDAELYYKSCRTVENFIVLPSGGAIRDPGTIYLAETRNSGADPARLIPFVIDVSGVPTAYILVLTAGYMRFMKNDAYLGAPYEVATPWSTIAEVKRLKYRQTESAMYFFIDSYKPQKLTRTSDTNWTLGDVTWTGTTPPDFNGTYKPGAVCMYGQRMWLSGSLSAPSKIWGSKVGDIENFGTGDRLEFDVYHKKTVHIKSLIERNEIVFIGDNAQGALSGKGLAISGTNFKISVESELDANADPAPQGLVVSDRVLFMQKRKLREFLYEEQRQGWSVPDMTFHASHIGGGYSFLEGAVQTHPFTVLWLVAGNGELVGFTFEGGVGTLAFHRRTTDGEVQSVANPWSTDEFYICVKRVINGSTKYYIEKTKSLDHWKADQMDAWYVDAGVQTKKAYGYAVTGATQAAPVVITSTIGALLANGDKVKLYGIGGASELNGVWTVKNVAAGTFELDETDDAPAWSGTTQYYTNNMVIYSGKNYIALQNSLNKQPDTETAYWKTWPTAYTSGGFVDQVVNTISGLAHLEGETVRVLTNGARHPDRVVSSGAITLQSYFSNIIVGLGYDSTLKPMRLVPPGRKKTISWMSLRLIDTIGGKVGPEESRLVPFRFRTGGDLMDTAIPPFTGDYDLTFPTGYSSDGDIIVRQDDPLPMHVVMIMAEVETNEVR